MQNRLYKTDALILRRRDLGEADRLLTIATPAGKRTIIARGVRKTTSRLAGHIELFTFTHMMLAKARNLDVVTQSVVLNRFQRLHTDLVLLSCAYYVSELYDCFTDEDQQPDQLFAVLLQTLLSLEKARQPDLVQHACALHMLQEAGYLPHLWHCVICQDELTEAANRFSPALGGVLCPHHGQADPQALPMSLNTFKVLRHLVRQPFDSVERLSVSETLEYEVGFVLRAYLRCVLERDFKTVPFLESLHHTRNESMRTEVAQEHGQGVAT